MRVFEAVAAHRTATGAAAALGLAPSSVSEQLRTLERSLGTELFERAPRGMSLTPAGERLLPWSRRLLDQAEQARREVAATHARLRLGALEAIAATHVPAVLARLAEHRPDVETSLHTDTARDSLLGAVAAGALEAALILDAAGPLGELGFYLPPAPLDHLDLQDVPLSLVAAPTHPLAHATTLTREDLRGRRLLVDAPTCSFHLAGERLLGHAVDRIPTGGLTVTRACAEQGLGIALLPDFAIPDQLAAGTLARLPLTPPPLRLRLIWRADHTPLPDLHQVLRPIPT
ncbi:LysR family transcriptional regulator [Streptomyces sp. NRRL S-350]|uniref:LysR family transcriptional regulator n=1 Tax=Streptomyces sp. NRRL S-350 TaxID=1463902 RepID=UPI000AB32AE2|nr:LysR family transcriptional regulator [Streptomyces sp. NRRL S-350]